MMLPNRFLGLATGLLCVAAAASPTRAASEYTVEVGDVIELSVVGVPELQSRIQVNVDGLASFPLVGDIRAEGRSVPEIRQEVRAVLSRKVAPRSTGKGVEDSVAFSPEQINVVVTEYRPVSVNGDVSEPGQQKYRPGMTVREAVAVCGGYATAQSRGSGGDAVSALDVQSDYGVLLNEFAREQVRLLRLKLELEDDNIDPATMKERLQESGAKRLSEAADLETMQFASRQSRTTTEREFLLRSKKTVERRLAILAERRINATRVLATDTSDFDRINELFQKGSAVIGRLSDSRRSVLFSATQLLETESAIAAMERERDYVERDLVKLDQDRRSTILTEYQDSRLKVQNLETRLMGVGQKLNLATREPRDTFTREADPPTIRIFRRDGRTPEQIDADPDSELRPGDVLEVSLRSKALKRSVSR